MDECDEIPQEYIDEVKKMWLVYAGESHSQAIRTGMELLEGLDGRFQVHTVDYGTPKPYTDQNLRVSRGTWGDYSNVTGWIYSYGEEDWFTNSTALARTKSGITYCNTNNLMVSAMGFGWCWDDTFGPQGGEIDPIYGVHWYGGSVGGAEGSRRWGLDAGDYAITGNSVNMDSYLSATQGYIDYCKSNSYPTKVFFTTGPVDTYYIGEAGYQGWLKHEYIRDYVEKDTSRILFDYADILCWDDNGVQTISTWNGHTFPIITDSNLGDGTIGHIGSAGSIRLAKAMWWMLARMAGWDGVAGMVPVTSITVSGTAGATTISQDNGTLALTTTVIPTNATNKAVTWSIINGTGQATISTSGVVTAVANGVVTARATATDGSGVYGQLVITISGQIIPVTGITVTGAGGSSMITTDGGQLQLTATVTPSDATNKTVTWSIINGTGQATINTTGLVTAVSGGTVTAVASANDGSRVQGTLLITITNQVIPVTSITVSGTGEATTISQDNGTLALTATVLPTNATNKAVTWSIINGTGQATISTSGVVTAVANGTVTARAIATNGSGVYGQLVISISGQIIPVTGITITGAGGLSTITQDNGTLALTAIVLPSNATNKSVTWSIVTGTGQATISTTGVVTAVSNGTVTARATAADGIGVSGDMSITISGQAILVTKIDLAAFKGEPVISTPGGTLQLTASIAPANATNQAVTWSVINNTGQATVSQTGLVTAVANGTATVRATANDGSGIFGEIVITITNQIVLVTQITITGEGGLTGISVDDGTLRLIANVVPSNATNRSVIWSLFSGNGHASLTEDGLLTARSNGTVTVRAMANDGTKIFGQIEITISNQIVPVSSIKVKPKTKSFPTITVNGDLELAADILPEDATDKQLDWSVIDGTGLATISQDGILKGLTPGEVLVVAKSCDGSGVSGELAITINLVESIKVRYNRNEIVVQVPDHLIPAKACLHNLYGSHVLTKVIDTNECIIDISGLMPGVYVVSVYNSVVQDAAKIVIPY